ncbi:ADP-ribosylglycohydrolase family protein [Micromonospora sp. LOL_023]|uniref:ADP-ribosylglycohydrolase family protein n=1 Tax=Micromonospora sp. LOL_023 TaxID=3345418 RepID=UPI003A87CD75
MTFTLYDDVRLGFARDSLAGLSVGDALGERCVRGRHPAAALAAGQLPAPPWTWTDDTEMACVLVDLLGTGAAAGRIDRDRLAAGFAARHDPARGYGRGAADLLRLVRDGTPWPVAASTAFDGQGSWGNGAAMRVAPLGAYYADSLTRAAGAAAASAEVTHAHPDGIAGAVAVATAAAFAVRARVGGRRPTPGEVVDATCAAVDAGSAVHRGLRQARRLIGRPVAIAAEELGNGSTCAAADTVPFAIWVAARHLDDYPAAIVACVAAGGDVDTIAAITGGVVAGYVGCGGPGGVPDDWLAAREPLPAWIPRPG